MKVEHIQAKDAPAPGGSYSHGVVANGFLYTWDQLTLQLEKLLTEE